MSRLPLFLCCFLSSLSLPGLADDTAVDGSKALAPAVHKQEKFAGRAGRLADINNTTRQNSSQVSPSVDGPVHERKALTKEERRALRRQINESEVRYPRRRL